jgi:hypothetical protein
MQGDVGEQPAAVEAGEVCANCGRTIGRLEQPFICGEQIVCFGCYRHMNSDQPSEGSAHGEHSFFSDARVKVTSRRLSFAATSYDIGLVRFARLRVAPARRWLGWLLAGCGLAAALFGLNLHLDETDKRFLAIGGAMAVLGILWALVSRSTFSIILTLSDSEHVAFRTRSRRYAKRVLDAVAEAIIERGQSVATPSSSPIQGDGEERLSAFG